jgi:hypothetical protein
MCKDMKKISFVVVLVSIIYLSASAQTIKQSFEEQILPCAPDYSLESSWSALPWRKDTPDDVPIEEYSDNQDQAMMDVFFIHPTTISAEDGVWNADIFNEKLNQKVDNLPIKHQASVFNGEARVFAPRYRQANYEAFMELGSSNSNQSLALAYSDVRAAFLYYLENWNEGRPFIIAGHSQGTFHAITLVKELVDTTALIDQMFLAYLVGMPIKLEDFKYCQPCQNALDNHCYLTWNTVKRKSYPKFYDEYFQGAVCHNPLSWELNQSYCRDEYHEGLVPRDFKKFAKKNFGAKVENGVLWVDAVSLPGIPFTRFVKNWHIGDYNLFYGNIRVNLADRVNQYLLNK